MLRAVLPGLDIEPGAVEYDRRFADIVVAQGFPPGAGNSRTVLCGIPALTISRRHPARRLPALAPLTA
jgi:hypothetical protein